MSSKCIFKKFLFVEQLRFSLFRKLRMKLWSSDSLNDHFQNGFLSPDRKIFRQNVIFYVTGKVEFVADLQKVCIITIIALKKIKIQIMVFG